MTPKEAAQYTIPPNQVVRVKEFLLTASSQEIQEFIHLITAMDYVQEFNLARVALDIRLAKDAVLIANKLTRQTDRLIRFTIGLYVFTIVIAGFAFIQITIMLMDYFSKSP